MSSSWAAARTHGRFVQVALFTFFLLSWVVASVAVALFFRIEGMAVVLVLVAVGIVLGRAFLPLFRLVYLAESNRKWSR
ncbi:hypothetical protein ACFQPA_04140 [Halomarina halobia]|uniref:Uncharacterized protein n=1 Tax=Halomarina halobia TaxID=3033386 RepID=A0ABD6A664_9EURY|nr:hypothetical protein [Halomarina sp. PSR21]